MPDPEDHHDQALLRYTSSIPNAVPGDMHVAILARTGWHAVGHRTGTFFMWVNKTYSRGQVALASVDPRTEPKVDFRLLSDWRDMDRLKEGYRLLAGVLADPRMDGMRGGPCLPHRLLGTGAQGLGAGLVQHIPDGFTREDARLCRPVAPVAHRRRHHARTAAR